MASRTERGHNCLDLTSSSRREIRRPHGIVTSDSPPLCSSLWAPASAPLRLAGLRAPHPAPDPPKPARATRSSNGYAGQSGSMRRSKPWPHAFRHVAGRQIFRPLLSGACRVSPPCALGHPGCAVGPGTGDPRGAASPDHATAFAHG
jgi:hypothetical protein